MTQFEEQRRAHHERGFVIGEAQVPEGIPGFAAFGHIACKGLHNTRDLGGMPAADGRHIKEGRLIRSGALHHATDDDLRLLEDAHGLVRVVDLRTDLERTHDPDPKDRMRTQTVFYDLPVFEEQALGITREAGVTGDLKMLAEYNDGPHKVVEALYPEALLGSDGKRAYSDFLRVLLEADEGATLWHCTEGKDRAGLAAVLVETALGVPEEYVRADYLATNIFVRTRAERTLDSLAHHRMARDLDADVDALFYAYPAYLDTALGAVQKQFGSLGGYLADGLGFSAADCRQLQQKYLEA